VQQLSLTYRIALAALLVVAGLWLVVLKPRSGAAGESTAPTAPGVTGLAGDVAKAKGAVGTSNAAAGATQAAADAVGGTGTATAPAPGASPAKPAPAAKAATGLEADAASGDPSGRLLAAVDRGKVAVVLFWDRQGSDDRATHRALKDVDRHGGNVVVRSVPISRVGRYEAITRGVEVTESPTVVVIGQGGEARAIAGFTAAAEIDQAVGDLGGTGFEAGRAFHLTGFAKVADDACRDFNFRYGQATTVPTSAAAADADLAAGLGEFFHLRDRLRAAPARTARERALKSALLDFVAADSGLGRTARAQLARGVDPATVWTGLLAGETGVKAPMVAAAKKARVRGCWTID
jgi:hypothetical protein